MPTNIRLAVANETVAPQAAIAAKLKALAERLDAPNTFAKGQLIAWKPGLQNRKAPDYGEPVIVTAVLPEPIFDPSERSASSPYFQEPLSLVIGMLRDDDVIEFRVDGRRFEPFEQ